MSFEQNFGRVTSGNIVEDIDKNESTLEKSEELENFLDKIDFDLLANLFAEEMARSGAGIDAQFNFIDREDIYTSTGDGSFGDYCFRNYISMNVENIKKNAQDSEPLNEDMLFLKILVHEQAHATSSIVRLAEATENECNVTTRIGYQYNDEKSVLIEDGEVTEAFSEVGNLFNEGVTDLLAHELVQKYLSQKGEYSQDCKKNLLETGKYSYHLEKNFVAAFVRKISTECEVPVDSVWNSVKQGYFSGLRIYERDGIESLFDDIIGPKFSYSFHSKDKKILTAYFIKYLVEHYSDPWNAKQKERALDFIDILEGIKNKKPRSYSAGF